MDGRRAVGWKAEAPSVPCGQRRVVHSEMVALFWRRADGGARWRPPGLLLCASGLSVERN